MQKVNDLIAGLVQMLSGPNVSALANVVTIIGVSFTTGIVLFSSIMPWYVHNELEKEVKKLKFESSRNYVEFVLGKSNVTKEICYDFYEGTEKTIETGRFDMYYKDSNIIVCYFDKNDSLFGYMVTSGSKFFNPEIPFTSGKRLLKSQYSKIQPINTVINYEQQDLMAYSFFTRTSSVYIEKYYTEIFDLKELGVVGVAATNLPDTDSTEYQFLFDYLSDLSWYQDEADDEFRKVYETKFDHTTFFCDDSDINEEITEKGYFLRAKQEKPNSYFAFKTSDGIDTHQFIKEQLSKHYFVDEFLVKQQK